jgi:hypothetical protein
MTDWMYDEFKKQAQKKVISLLSSLMTDGASDLDNNPIPCYCAIVMVYMVIGIFYEFIQKYRYRERRGEALTTGDVSDSIFKMLLVIPTTPKYIKKEVGDTIKQAKDQFGELRAKRELRRVAH